MNNLSRKRKRDEKQITITIGKLPKGLYYLIGDSLDEGSKIKIPLPKEDSKSNANKDKQSAKSSTLNNNEDNISNSPSHKNSPLLPEEIPLIAKLNEQNKTLPIYMPVCANWFNFDEIHEIESKSLPEFFCGKYPTKTPKVYKEFRNHIISLYRENKTAYLTATTCRKHLPGDTGSIVRIHALLEHWGLINFKVDPLLKNPSLPRAYNFKSPVFFDGSGINIKEKEVFPSKPNDTILNNKQGDTNKAIDKQTILLPIQTIDTSSEAKTVTSEVRGLFPNNNHPESLYRPLFNEQQSKIFNQVTYMDKTKRPKCTQCRNICDIQWYVHLFKDEGEKEDYNNDDHNIEMIFSHDFETNINKTETLITLCEGCFDKEDLPEGLKKEDFELSNVFNGLLPDTEYSSQLNEKLIKEQWTEEESKELLRAIDLYGEGNWNDIVQVFNGRRTKAECILHLMQLPIKEPIKLSTGTLPDKKKEETNNNSNSNPNEPSNPLLNQVLLFAKMFEKYSLDDLAKEKPTNKDLTSTEYLKEVMYKTYTKSINVSQTLKNEERDEMTRIMNHLTYMQLKKVELKLNYIAEFEKMIHYETMQLKTIQSQIMQDRIQLAMKKNDLNKTTMKFKEAHKGSSIVNPVQPIITEPLPSISNIADVISLPSNPDTEMKITNLN